MYNFDNESVNAIRFLSVNQINKAKSGHPGICLGAAPIAHALFTRQLVVNPKDTNWYNRDRFVLSAGHGSAMLYSVMHLSGYDIAIDDLKTFRQLGSKCAGHPEYGMIPGIEATTGPLGQGIAMSVGMAIAEKHLAAVFNKEDNQIIDHYTYAICGDGCLQEGVAQEAISLAGNLKLNKFIILYDSNDIQLDGPVSMANTENVKTKFEGMGFNYFLVADGNDVDAIDAAIAEAKKGNKPSIIEIKTLIGYGSVDQGKCSCHGSPLGAEKTELLKAQLGWNYGEFEVPQTVYDLYEEHVAKRGREAEEKWNAQLEQYKNAYPVDYMKLMHLINGETYADFNEMPKFEVGFEDATRNTCGVVMTKLGEQEMRYVGGCADLTKTTMAKGLDGNFSDENPAGRNICYGVREHAMGAIVNGLTLSGLKGFGGGFLVFSDYMKPAIRLAAIMEIPSLFVFSHNSPLVGEDGPTHEPIEHMSMLRSIPNCNVMVPADPNEMVYAYQAMESLPKTPSVVTTTRQKVKTLEGTSAEGVAKGAYVIYPEQGKLDGVIIACGAEVGLAIDVAKELEQEGKYVRVVSMPSMYLYDLQTKEYKESVIPTDAKTMAIEMACTMPWYKYSRNVYGVDKFGLSAPAKVVQEQLGFTVEKVKEYYNSL